MRTLLDAVHRHETAAFVLLTYACSWLLWKAFDRAYLNGQLFALPFIVLGMYGPGLVSLWLSARSEPGPRQGRRRVATIAFLATWLAASLLITLDQVLNEGRAPTALAIAACVVAALIPAAVLSSAFRGAPGVRRHLATLVRPRGAPPYYVLAAVLFVGIWGLGVLVSRALGLPVSQRDLPAAATSLGVAGAVALTFFYTCLPNALGEEVGWRGFALPRLQARLSPLAASLVLWACWALWHGPAYLGGFAPQSLGDTLAEWVLVLPVTVIFTWLYNRTRASLAAVALLHPAMNTATRFLPITLAGILLLFVLAMACVIADRMWDRPPGTGPCCPPPGLA